MTQIYNIKGTNFNKFGRILNNVAVKEFGN